MLNIGCDSATTYMCKSKVAIENNPTCTNGVQLVGTLKGTTQRKDQQLDVYESRRDRQQSHGYADSRGDSSQQANCEEYSTHDVHY